MHDLGFPDLKSIHTIVFDFDGVFTDNKVWLTENGMEAVRCDRADGLAFDLLRSYLNNGRLNADIFILTKETNLVVVSRAKKLKIKCENGIKDKLGYLVQYLNVRFPNDINAFRGLVYLGNDLNDLPVMRRAGFSVAPVDAHPLVKSVASVVMNESGGNGFIRAFVEQLLQIKNLSQGELDELISNC